MSLTLSSKLLVTALVAAVLSPAATPLSPEDKIKAAEATINLAAAQLRAREIADANERAQRALVAIKERYLQILKELQESHEAGDCTLNAKQEWICDASATESQPAN